MVRYFANYGETKFSQCQAEPGRHSDISTSTMIHAIDEVLLPKGLLLFSLFS